MAEKGLLEELAALSREDQAASLEGLDERWDALCADRLPGEARQALSTEAKDSELGEIAWKAFQPPSEELKGRLVEAMAENQRAEPPPAVIPFPRRRLGGPALWLAAAAAAVAVFAWSSLTSGSVGVYELGLRGQEVERGIAASDHDSIRWIYGQTFSLELAPVEDPRAAPRVRLYVYRDPELRRWRSAEAGLEKVGHVHSLEGTFDLQLEPGAWELIAVYGRGKLPAEAELKQALEGAPMQDTTWRIARHPFSI